MRKAALRQLLACAALAALAAGGCGRGTGGAPGPAASPGERRFALEGEVLSVDLKRKVLVVRHNEVAGYMPAMTMEFPVSAGDAAAARPGERIRAELVVEKAGALRLEKIWAGTRIAKECFPAASKVGSGSRLCRLGSLPAECGFSQENCK